MDIKIKSLAADITWLISCSVVLSVVHSGLEIVACVVVEADVVEFAELVIF